MPSRIVREGINSSPRINALSPLAELFYRRLMSVADDYGRFHAAPGTLRGACWPTCPEKVREGQIMEWLKECSDGPNPLIVFYEVAGCTYLEICDFGQQKRGKSKFPERLSVANHPLITCESSVHASRSRISYFDSRIAEAEAEPDATRPEPIPIRKIATDAESRIRKLADQCPDPQDYEFGVNLAVQEIISSANPDATLAAMETNLPLWWAAMRDGRARMKPLRFVITDRDYLRRPREPTSNGRSSKLQEHQAKQEAWESIT